MAWEAAKFMSDAGVTGAVRSPERVVADLERAATRTQTPCGAGVMAWRAWGSGPPLLLLHGAHGSWKHWIHNIEPLAATRRVLAADLPGYGDSALPERPGEGDSFAEAIAAGLREQLPPGQAIDVVGFSLGGVIAAHLAAIAPELVRRLIVVDTGGLDLPVGDVATRPVRDLEGEALRETHRYNLLRLMLHSPDAVDDLALHIQATNVPRGRVSPKNLVMPDRLATALARVRAPVDAIWGEFDAPHPHPDQQLAAIRRSHPEAEMRVIANAGHWSMYEAPEAFDAALAELLARAPRR
jgi:pimeloyl-ACP methyl ester carboxylesterase